MEACDCWACLQAEEWGCSQVQGRRIVLKAWFVVHSLTKADHLFVPGLCFPLLTLGLDYRER